MHLILYSDGGSRGNPGPSAFGYVIYNLDRKQIANGGKYLGKSTNNIAEYMGVYAGVLKAKELGAIELQIYLDSQLIVRQLNGQYQVKQPELIKIYDKLMIELKDIKWTVKHIPRKQNAEADAIVNMVLNTHKTPIRSSQFSMASK
jgi:ribonuclease HI